MKDSLRARMLEAIELHRMIRPGDRVGIAVSGGADSVALLRLLEQARGELGITLVVLHFQHGLRGNESAGDQEFVVRLSAQLGLEFVAEQEDVAAWARRHHQNLEEAGRRLRSAFFERIVAEGRAARVAVAHTADDQAETLLAHLLRGTGLTGLAGIYPVAGHVVRPLLDVRRAELRAWLEQIGQSWREDATNADVARLRARLRHELLPLLERNFQPRVVERLSSLARLAREEEAFWSWLVDSRRRALAEETPAGLSLRVEDLLEPFERLREAGRWPAAAFSRRFVRSIVESLCGSRQGLTAGHVEQVLRLARESSSGRRVILPHGLIVERSFDRLLFSIQPGLAGASGTAGIRAASYEYEVELPERGASRVTIAAIGCQLCLKVVDWPPSRSETRLWTEALDADLLRPPFLLRNWQPGDVFRPRGRRSPRKVKELFREGRVPLQERAACPVLTSGGRLAWVRGLPVSEEFAARAKTRLGVLISEESL